MKDMDFSKLYQYADNVVITILIIVAAALLWNLFSRLFKSRQARMDDLQSKSVTYLHFLYNAIKYVIIILAVIGILSVNGVNVGGIVAGLGIVSAIIGLALQDELKDAVMGVHFLTDNFFHVGDVVEYNGIRGKVLSYNMKYVRLESLTDGGIISVCNRNISEIMKCSDIMFVDIPLSYEDDYEKIHDALRQCCNELCQSELVSTCIYLGTQSFDDSSVAYRSRIECRPENMAVVRRQFLAIVQRVLKENGLEIPYSHLDVNIIKNTDLFAGGSE